MAFLGLQDASLLFEGNPAEGPALAMHVNTLFYSIEGLERVICASLLASSSLSATELASALIDRSLGASGSVASSDPSSSGLIEALIASHSINESLKAGGK